MQKHVFLRQVVFIWMLYSGFNAFFLVCILQNKVLSDSGNTKFLIFHSQADKSLAALRETHLLTGAGAHWDETMEALSMRQEKIKTRVRRWGRTGGNIRRRGGKGREGYRERGGGGGASSLILFVRSASRTTTEGRRSCGEENACDRMTKRPTALNQNHDHHHDCYYVVSSSSQRTHCVLWVSTKPSGEFSTTELWQRKKTDAFNFNS